MRLVVMLLNACSLLLLPDEMEYYMPISERNSGSVSLIQALKAAILKSLTIVPYVINRYTFHIAEMETVREG